MIDHAIAIADMLDAVGPAAYMVANAVGAKWQYE